MPASCSAVNPVFVSDSPDADRHDSQNANASCVLVDKFDPVAHLNVSKSHKHGHVEPNLLRDNACMFWLGYISWDFFISGQGSVFLKKKKTHTH